MAEFRARIEIDVDADNELDAAKQAWELLSAPDAWLPVVDVYKLDDRCAVTGGPVQVDLQREQDDSES
jgi:hypothetical protein